MNSGKMLVYQENLQKANVIPTTVSNSHGSLGHPQNLFVYVFEKYRKEQLSATQVFHQTWDKAVPGHCPKSCYSPPSSDFTLQIGILFLSNPIKHP